jgi:hypothetical protein
MPHRDVCARHFADKALALDVKEQSTGTAAESQTNQRKPLMAEGMPTSWNAYCHRWMTCCCVLQRGLIMMLEVAGLTAPL